MANVHVLSMRDERSNRYPPLHWQKRAKAAWETARQTKDPETQHKMETIARLYEKLAEFTESRLFGGSGD
jgi:hypothetical protein